MLFTSPDIVLSVLLQQHPEDSTQLKTVTTNDQMTFGICYCKLQCW